MPLPSKEGGVERMGGGGGGLAGCNVTVIMYTVVHSWS